MTGIERRDKAYDLILQLWIVLAAMDDLTPLEQQLGRQLDQLLSVQDEVREAGGSPFLAAAKALRNAQNRRGNVAGTDPSDANHLLVILGEPGEAGTLFDLTPMMAEFLG